MPGTKSPHRRCVKFTEPYIGVSLKVKVDYPKVSMPMMAMTSTGNSSVTNRMIVTARTSSTSVISDVIPNPLTMMVL